MCSANAPFVTSVTTIDSPPRGLASLCDLSICICPNGAIMFPDEAMDKLNNSVRVNEVDPSDFVALFVPGGHGTGLPSCTFLRLGIPPGSP